MRENLLSVSTFGVEGGAFTAGRGLAGCHSGHILCNYNRDLCFTEGNN